MEAFTVLLKSYEHKRKFFSVFKVIKMKKKVIVKVKKKARDEEAGKSENGESAYVQMIGKKKNENDWEEVVKEIMLAIYTIAIKEKKES